MQKYTTTKYNTKERFINYWHQISEVLSFKPKTVLEIGVGAHVVHNFLKDAVEEVRSLDIEPDTQPDIVGSVIDIPLPDRSFDVILAAEILEHLPFDSFPRALKEIARVGRLGAVISLPHNGMTFSYSCKIPLIPWIHVIWKIPYFLKTAGTTDEHYWEIGLSDYPLRRIMREMRNAGFVIEKKFIPHDDTYRMFFILRKI